MYIDDKLKQLKFETITPIQEGVFKYFFKPNHLVGLAPTGTGKTHAYLLPILSQMNFSLPVVQAVIVVPTSELVNQVERMVKDIEDRLVVHTYYGGTNHQKEQEWLTKFQPHLVITTPEQLKEYVIIRKLLNVHTAKYLVFDEADMMFDFSFLSTIDQLLPTMPKAKYLLFSATISPSMKPFITSYFGKYDLIDTSGKHELKITYKLINIKYQLRMNALEDVLKHLNPFLCFIFVSKKENQDIVYQRLVDLGYHVANLNSSLGVKKRNKLIDEIQALKYPYVVTSDLGARGLDFKVSHVIHFDLPYHLEFFFHRSGRTGRMNDSGEVITFMTVDDHRKIEKLKQKGVLFIPYEVTEKGITRVRQKKEAALAGEKEALKKVKKVTKVSPNYKKKMTQQKKKIKQELRRKYYANQNR